MKAVPVFTSFVRGARSIIPQILCYEDYGRNRNNLKTLSENWPHKTFVFTTFHPESGGGQGTP